METSPSTGPKNLIKTLLAETTPEKFDEWYEEHRYAENIRSGKPWFNTPPPVKPPERHSPSYLKQCHRKIYYNQLQAPEESEDPRGIFWTGTQFEEEVMMPFLESVVGDDTYVRNSMWVDFTVETDVGEIHIRGETDPVLVDGESRPVLLTEIKTKQSIKNLSEPNEHHLAQVYAYVHGLSAKWNSEVADVLIIYGSRTSLSIKVFHVEFDEEYWRDEVVEWARRHTEYRLNDELPPAEPEFGWECEFCQYKTRCGRGGDDRYKDVGADGFLPQFDEYPQEKVVKYLQTHQGAKLTPTLARKYPELMNTYEVYDWYCEACSSRFSFQSVSRDGGNADPSTCPVCTDSQTYALLSDPKPTEQHVEVADEAE